MADIKYPNRLSIDKNCNVWDPKYRWHYDNETHSQKSEKKKSKLVICRMNEF